MLYYNLVRHNPQIVNVFILQSCQQVLYIVFFLKILSYLYIFLNSYQTNSMLNKIIHKILILVLYNKQYNNKLAHYNIYFTIVLFITLSIIIQMIKTSILNDTFINLQKQIQLNIPEHPGFDNCEFYYNHLLHSKLPKIVTDFLNISNGIFLNILASIFFMSYGDILCGALLLVNIVYIYKQMNLEKKDFNRFNTGNQSKIHTINNSILSIMYLLAGNSGMLFVFMFFIRLYEKTNITNLDYVYLLNHLLNNDNRLILDNSPIYNISMKKFYNIHSILINNMRLFFPINIIYNKKYTYGIHYIETDNSSLLLKSLVNLYNKSGFYINNYKHNDTMFHNRILYLSNNFNCFQYGTVMENMQNIFNYHPDFIVKVCFENNINPGDIINPHYGFNKQLQIKYLNLIAAIFIRGNRQNNLLLMDNIPCTLHKDYIDNNIVICNIK